MIHSMLILFLFPLIACSSKDQQVIADSLVSTVQFVSSDGIVLEGTLELPTLTGTHPVVVFIHGSGRATRSDYQEVVNQLLPKGYAVFRYDKRGVGASQGTYSGVSAKNSSELIPLLASDAAAAISQLKKNAVIDPGRVILIGASQAGWIIPAVVATTGISLTVCISGPAVSVGEEIFYSQLAETGSYTQDEADQMLASFSGPKGYDPLSNIEMMHKPSLWIFGGKDVSIPIKRTLDLLDSVRSDHKLPIEIKLYPNANHGIFNANTGKFENYIPPMIEWLTVMSD